MSERKPYQIAISSHGRSCWGWLLTTPTGEVSHGCADRRHGAIRDAMQHVPMGAPFNIVTGKVKP